MFVLMVCAARILWEDGSWGSLGNPTTTTNQEPMGLYGGASGWDCVPCHDNTHTIPKPSNFDSWWAALDQHPTIDLEGPLERDVDVMAGVALPPALAARVAATAAARAAQHLPPVTTLEDGRRILYNQDLVKATPDEVPECKDLNENCTWWAEIGECINNPS